MFNLFKKNKYPHSQSDMINILGHLVEFGNRYLTLSGWFLRGHKNVFRKVEIMMAVITTGCIGLLFSIDRLPTWAAITISILLAQRIIEFVMVYSRNFIFNHGRVFSDFKDHKERGQWLLLMFTFNIFQIVIIFAIWYRLISILDPSSFSQSLNILNSVYFSIITFLTVGYGDIIPLTQLSKAIVMTQSVLTFYILVIVINGLISVHFNKR